MQKAKERKDQERKRGTTKMGGRNFTTRTNSRRVAPDSATGLFGSAGGVNSVPRIATSSIQKLPFVAIQLGLKERPKAKDGVIVSNL